MRIAVFSTKSFDREFFERSNKNFTDIHLKFFDVPLNTDTAKLTKGYEGICVFVNDQLNAETIALLKENDVKLIALRCAGFNNVDLKAAEEHGLKVVRVPAYSPQAVAEHALALIMTLNRKTHKAYNRVREGNFSLERLIGFDVHNRTVGVIGTGKIGMHFCKIMQGLGCRVIAYDKYPSDTVKGMGIPYVTLDELFAQANIISLHCPLTEETEHLINEVSLSKLKKGTMLINTSRGALIDTTCAIEALKSGQLGYLGIDVYEQEEQLFFRDLSESIIKDDQIMRLISFPNVLITAHQGFLTNEALEQIAIVTLTNIEQFSKGQKLENEVVL
ncbi:2-hydroxyacid dehydrogenase [Robertkochia solimangrovi]|uniref:2-hydroxyacid dehydrogenase n=1 Tax=Robertkochia solimangrovi TaxID=2213046 RepID=UPI00117DF753|nr:2-hydroxyacid dehydrogenase [Robertkochia solimangrovi]TRZ43757.1 2-hydroxyacid dehydrogenase [Robertkochia solimangrovi]